MQVSAQATITVSAELDVSEFVGQSIPEITKAVRDTMKSIAPTAYFWEPEFAAIAIEIYEATSDE
jgi:hypothetical protein